MAGNPYADHVNSIAKYVVSPTLEKAEWNNSAIIHGDDLVSEATYRPVNADGHTTTTG